MLRIDRIAIGILICGYVMLIPSIQHVKFIDELCAMLLGTLAFTDCIVNNNWRRYTLLWVIIAIITFYAVYSLTIVHYNTPKAIFVDWIIEHKPFIPFIVFLAIRPRFTSADKQIIRAISIVNIIICVIALASGNTVTKAVLFHVSYGGIVIYISALFYLFCGIDNEGKISRRDLAITIIFLTCGLLCTRSKYYGAYVVSLFMLFAYRPGMLKAVTVKHVISLVVIIALVIAVAWSKFEYYFLTGNSDTFDPETVESFARPVLYLTGGLILVDHIPFGSGLASFATFASADSYSNLYYEYGINNVYGLSEQMHDFMCDAFYPSLAQFGFVGLVLFIYFWRYAYKRLRALIRHNASRYKYAFIIGSLIICHLLIESTSSTTLTQSCGMMEMCLLGMICAQGQELQAKPAADANDCRKRII